MAALFTPRRDCKLRPFLTPPMFVQGTHHFAPGSDRYNQRQVLGSLGKFRNAPHSRRMFTRSKDTDMSWLL